MTKELTIGQQRAMSKLPGKYRRVMSLLAYFIISISYAHFGFVRPLDTIQGWVGVFVLVASIQFIDWSADQIFSESDENDGSEGEIENSPGDDSRG